VSGWILLRPGWRNDLTVTAQALGLQWGIVHLEHTNPCPEKSAILSPSQLAGVLDRCTCSSLRFRPVQL